MTQPKFIRSEKRLVKSEGTEATINQRRLRVEMYENMFKRARGRKRDEIGEQLSEARRDYNAVKNE
jgi:hypothetical protein